MASIIVWITVIILSIQISSLESSGVSATFEFVLYQHRVEILYNHMKAEGCSLPGYRVKRHVLSETVVDRLVVEKALYEKLYDGLIKCRKTKLTPTQKPTSTTKTPSPTKSTQTPTSAMTAAASTAAASTASTTTASTTTASTTTASTTTASTTTASTTTAPTTTTSGIQCPKEYIFNPVSSTCLRLLTPKMTWSAAKSTCESAGESLAVFETQESVRWLRRFIIDSETPAAWKRDIMLIGLKYSNGAWRWAGRLTTALSDDAVWHTGFPKKDLLSSYTHPYGCVSVRDNWNGFVQCSRGPKDNEDVFYSICERRI